MVWLVDPGDVVAPRAVEALELAGVPNAIATADGRRRIASVTGMFGSMAAL